MNIFEIFETLIEDQINDSLYGDISFEDEMIKWEYDGLYKDDGDMQGHLEMVVDSDKTIIEEVLEECNVLDDLLITEPEIDETRISFEISY